MAMQDLTPQLRTRLSRVERVVGWFVLLATLLLVVGFVYYFYVTAERKGWFIRKLPYYTYLKDATGLKLGDSVRLMGFPVGEVVAIKGTAAGNYWYTENQYNVFVQFLIRDPYYGYIWTDSKVRVASGDFLGARVLEVTKGYKGIPTAEQTTNGVFMLSERFRHDDIGKKKPAYLPLKGATNAQPKGYWLDAQESPALTERFDHIADRVEAALPGFFALTNRLGEMLSNGVALSSNLNQTVHQLQPVLANTRQITALLTNGSGSLGDWLLPTNLQRKIEGTLASAHGALESANTNVAMLSSNFNATLINLANITSNLNAQVQTNSSILTRISDTVEHADQFVQGLKRFWLVRSLFRKKPAEKQKPPSPASPRGKPWEE